MVAAVLDRETKAAKIRREAQWRASPDGIVWKEWRHLCWLDEEPIPPTVFAEPGEHYFQARVVIWPEGRVDETSPIYTWDAPT